LTQAATAEWSDHAERFGRLALPKGWQSVETCRLANYLVTTVTTSQLSDEDGRRLTNAIKGIAVFSNRCPYGRAVSDNWHDARPGDA
jgi:hypothetical protein